MSSVVEIRSFPSELSLTDAKQCESEALNILGELKPTWDRDSVKFEYFSVGITNKIFSASFDNEHVIFRVFGKNTNKVIDRENELNAWALLAQYGFAAELYGKFENGLVCGFLEGKTFDIEQMRNTGFHSMIASKIAQLHTKVPTEAKPMLFAKMRLFERQFTKKFDDPVKQAYYSKHFPVSFEEDVKELELKINKLKEPVAFCHNDLLVHNIVYNKEKASVNFIDYEYAFPNYALYDLANHFCEYAGVEGTPDYTKCLDKNQKWLFLNDYLRFCHPQVCERRLEVMFKHIPLFESASHLFWTLWALVQAQNSTIDFDYLSYASARYEQFQKRFSKWMTHCKN